MEEPMKRIVSICSILIVVLTACASAPSAPTAAPASTAESVVVTVVVTDVPAQATDAAPEPTDEPVAEATDTPEPVDTAVPGVAATNTRPPAVGAAVLINPTHSGNAFSLRCAPSQLTFGVTSINPAITGVDLYYRVVDKAAAQPSGTWLNGAKMNGDKKGNFTVEFSALQIAPDSRLAQGWFDYQFIGVNKYGDVVGRSDKYTQEITFTLDCP
jgi:hypothetical protein